MSDIATPPDWVPVDQRWCGMDRRTLVPALVVAVFGAIVFWGLPALNDAVTVQDPVKAGDVIQVGPSVMFVPIAGWDLLTGIRQGDGGAVGYPSAAQVTKDGVVFTVVADTYAGTPRQLLTQIRHNNDQLKNDSALVVNGLSTSFTTTTGQTGAIARFTSGTSEGLIAGFVFNGVGVEVVASGPDTIPNDTMHEVVRMLESVQPVSGTAEGNAS